MRCVHKRRLDRRIIWIRGDRVRCVCVYRVPGCVAGLIRRCHLAIQQIGRLQRPTEWAKCPWLVVLGIVVVNRRRHCGLAIYFKWITIIVIFPGGLFTNLNTSMPVHVGIRSKPAAIFKHFYYFTDYTIDWQWFVIYIAVIPFRLYMRCARSLAPSLYPSALLTSSAPQPFRLLCCLVKTNNVCFIPNDLFRRETKLKMSCHLSC